MVSFSLLSLSLSYSLSPALRDRLCGGARGEGDAANCYDNSWDYVTAELVRVISIRLNGTCEMNCCRVICRGKSRRPRAREYYRSFRARALAGIIISAATGISAGDLWRCASACAPAAAYSKRSKVAAVCMLTQFELFFGGVDL